MSNKQEEKQVEKLAEKLAEKQADKLAEKQVDKYTDLKMCISGMVCILLVGLIFFPFIYNRYFCSESLGSKIIGNLSLYLTIVPLSCIGIGLMFYIHPFLIGIIYFIYYGLIGWKWCSSRWLFVILFIQYLFYFFLMIKAKKVANMFLNISDDLNVDDIINKVKIDKKNDNSNK